MARSEVKTNILYFDDPGVPLVPMVIGGREKPKRQPKVEVPSTITAVNGHEDEYSLDNQGFQFIKHTTNTNWDDTESIKRDHYPEMAKLLEEVILGNKNFPKPSSVHILTHIMRYSPVEGEAPKGPAGPLYGVHVDQSLWASTGVAERWIGVEKATELLKKPRYQIINMWRPIYTVTRDPLAVCDARSVVTGDIVHVPVQFPDHLTEAVELRPPPAEEGQDGRTKHKWYFKDEMGPGDVMMFKQVDSVGSDTHSRGTPHCAFRDPKYGEKDGKPRQSIEIRALVFYDQAEP